MTWKYLQLTTATRRLDRIPRWGRMIARIAGQPDRAQRIADEASLLWELYSHVTDGECDVNTAGLIDGGIATKVPKLGLHAAGAKDADAIEYRKVPFFRRWQVSLAMDLWGAIAFDMMCGEHGDGKTPPVDRVKDDSKLETRVRPLILTKEAYHDGIGPYRDQDGKPINTLSLGLDLERLKTLNTEGLRHMVLSSDRKEIVFSDYSTQAFFAALWACRWATERQLQIIRSWIPDPYDDDGNTYREFWQMVIELPGDAVIAEQREKLLSPVFDGTLANDRWHPIRSSELIVKAFPLMRGTEAVKTFLSEFEDIFRGQKGPEKQAVAQRLLFDVDGQYDTKGMSHFHSLCEGRGGPEDDGTFEMGSEESEGGYDDEQPVHPVKVTPYRLHRFCVTNAEYELFDTAHLDLREFTDKVDQLTLDRHPVVSVSSWDGLAFGLWLGEREIEGKRYRFTLPTEAQWEYACRCKQQTPFTWGVDENGVQRDGNRVESS